MWGGTEAVFCLQAEVFACGYDVFGERLGRRDMVQTAGLRLFSLSFLRFLVLT